MNDLDKQMLTFKRYLRDAGGKTETVDVPGGVRVSWKGESRIIEGLSIGAICSHRWFQCSEDGVRLAEA